LWLQGEQDAGIKLLCTKVEVAGGPVFSLHPGFKPKIKDPNTKQSRPVVYCGLAAKEIAAWQPDALKFSEQVRQRCCSRSQQNIGISTACSQAVDLL
jgi:hypothetical protein